MARLDDCQQKMIGLLEQISSVNGSYQHARQLYTNLEQNPQADVSGLGLALCFDGGQQIPVPLTENREELLQQVADAANFLGSDLIRLWNEVYAVAAEAKQHCDQAQQPQPAQPPEPAPNPMMGQPGDAPVAHVPQSPPGQPPQQTPATRLTPVQTTPVGGS